MTDFSQHSYGVLDSAPKEKIINKIYDYLEQILLSFDICPKENENSITDRLCKNLNSHKPYEYPFYFHHQNIETAKLQTSTDMAVIATTSYIDYDESKNNYFLKIEAKRLDQTLPRNRENEYVIGEYRNGKCVRNSGGIERYKNGVHGSDVNYAYMLGYIQTDNSEYWFDKINAIIKKQIVYSCDTNITWSENDLLSPISNNERISSYESISSRVNNEDIKIRHVWVSKSNDLYP